MGIYYILPVVLLIAVVFISRTMQKSAIANVQSMTPEQIRARINDYFGPSFELNSGEELHAAWIGEEFQGTQSTGGQIAGAALNQLTKAAVGVSSYVPQVQVGLTSSGRVLFAREYSNFGKRGSFKQALAFAPGTQALDAQSTYPGQQLEPPMANPLGGGPKPEFIQFRSPTGETYEVWMAAGQTIGGFIPSFYQVAAGIPGANPARATG
jgi:hypothetical protein